MSSSLSELRKEYSFDKLSKKDVNHDPVLQFGIWFEEACVSTAGLANAMILSSVDDTGRPSSRVVLLKEYSNDGFVFFTNYNSRKGKDLEKNPFVSLLFFWVELERQIRIEGKVEKLGQDKSAKYFSSRPRQSQISAIASSQSEIVKDRSVLEDKFQQMEKIFDGKEIPLPRNWGGYLVKPDYFEYWQGRQSRLHDRISYRLENQTWKIVRLSP